MSMLQVVVLAILQGITEFLPISSSAHLALTPWLFGWPDQGLAFDIALHFGTLLAVIIYFFRDWLQIIGQGLGMSIGFDPELKRNRNLLWLLAGASIPVGIAGLLLKHQAEEVWRHQPYLIGGMLVGVGLLMALGERTGRKIRDLSHLAGIDAAAIGIAQALAVVPGTSRSGITITAGLFRDFDRYAAARFSFLLSTPAIAAAALKDVWDLTKHGGLAPELRTPFAVGILVSALTGCLVIGVFLRFLRRGSLNGFIAYRVIFGILVIALAYFRGYAG
ncbi:MAG: undecaprenyl-diphosphate phosphatase [Bryobacteraceae bacterium]